MAAAPSLPDAEALVAELASRIRPDITSDTALIGIHTGGVWLAQRLHADFALPLPVGTIDVSFHRDDFKNKGLAASVRPSDIRFPVTGADIILVDDVLYTGRTIRAALNEIFDYGRPRAVRLAALIDRGERQLPICAQYVGAMLRVARDQNIQLERDDDGRLRLALAPW